MRKTERALAILNLAGALPAELAEYFAARKIPVAEPASATGAEAWSHILVRDLEDYTALEETHGLRGKDISLVSLSQPKDLRAVVAHQGHLVLDDLWLASAFGTLILDKFFQSYGGIELGDNYPAFQEKGSFNITNPFSVGDYFDRVVSQGFEEGIEALSVKTFLDHLVMYLTSLRNEEKIGMPIEVTYGAFGDVFGVQLHFFAQGLSLGDVTRALSSAPSRRPLEYYLNTAVHAADFFDFSYLASASKVIVTGLWTKDPRMAFENRGLMFSRLEAQAKLTQYPSLGESSSLVSLGGIADHSEKVVLRGTADGPLEKVTVGGARGAESKDGAITVHGLAGSEKEPATRVTGSAAAEKDAVTIVQGQAAAERDGAALVKGGPAKDADAATTVKGAGKKTAQAGAVVKGLFDEESLPPELFTGEVFPKEENVVVAGDLELPEAAYAVASEEEIKDIVTVVKGKFEEEEHVIRIAGEKLDVDKFAFRIAAGIEQEAKDNNLTLKTLGQKLPDAIKKSLGEFATVVGKSVDDLSSHELDSFKVKHLPQMVQTVVKEVSADGGLTARLRIENDKLKAQIKSLHSELKIIKDSRTQMAQIQARAVQKASEIKPKARDAEDALRREFQRKLDARKVLDDTESKKLAELLEEEGRLLREAREAEIKTKRMSLEIHQKDSFFQQELEKVQKQVKAKDFMLIKSKETFTKLLATKDKEITDLYQNVEQLTKALATNLAQLKAAAREEKQSKEPKGGDGFKVRMENETPAPNIIVTGDQASKDESRKLNILNTKLQNQVDSSKKELGKLTERASSDHALIMSLRQEKAKLEQLLKKTMAETTKEKTTASAPNDQELKRLQAQNQVLETQLRDAGVKVSTLESKILELSKQQKPVGAVDEASKVKITHLEASVKKLTMDIVESRNQGADMKKEINKLRQEKTGLQNQIEKMKKDSFKEKGAAPKKPGGGKAA